MKFRDSALAHFLLDDLDGIEIGGAAHNPFNLPGRLHNVDLSADMTTVYKKAEIEQCGEADPVTVAAPADKLPFPDGSFGYVVSSHVLEHIHDPIGCLVEWARVLRPGGLIFAIVPHKERTFDRDRPRTTLNDLILRHACPIPDEISNDAHKSVWITEDVVELFVHVGLGVMWVEDVDSKVGNGLTIVARKR